MSTIESITTGAMLRYQAGRFMWCCHPQCGAVLDGARAVSVDFFNGRALYASRMYCSDCHDRNRAMIVRIAKASGCTAKFTDGRLLDAGEIFRGGVQFRLGARISAMVATRPEGGRKKAVVWKRVKGRSVEFVGVDVPAVIARQEWIVHRSTRGRRMTVTHLRSGLAAASGESLRGALLTAAGRFLRAEPEALADLFDGVVAKAPAA
jgi:hypothetical protein